MGNWKSAWGMMWANIGLLYMIKRRAYFLQDDPVYKALVASVTTSVRTECPCCRKPLSDFVTSEWDPEEAMWCEHQETA